MPAYMPANDAPSAKLATCFVTIGERRYAMLMAKDFEANANVETKEVPALGRTVKGVKPTGLTLKFKMTVYKCTEIFDDVIEEYKNTGVMPTFDIQTTNEDAATSVGSSSKIYTGCVLDGDVLLSMFDADGEFIEQSIEGYAQDFKRPEKYTNPTYM
jgi:hypothetical protein